MKEMRKYFEDKIEMMETQLNETREKLDVAMTREIDLLRQLLKTKDE